MTTTTFTISCSDVLERAIRQAASRTGEDNFSAWVRMVLIEHLEEEDIRRAARELDEERSQLSDNQ